MDNQPLLTAVTCGQMGHLWDHGICIICASVDSFLVPASAQWKAPCEAQPTEGTAGQGSQPEPEQEAEA